MDGTLRYNGWCSTRLDSGFSIADRITQNPGGLAHYIFHYHVGITGVFARPHSIDTYYWPPGRYLWAQITLQ